MGLDSTSYVKEVVRIIYPDYSLVNITAILFKHSL